MSCENSSFSKGGLLKIIIIGYLYKNFGNLHMVFDRSDL